MRTIVYLLKQFLFVLCLSISFGFSVYAKSSNIKSSLPPEIYKQILSKLEEARKVDGIANITATSFTSSGLQEIFQVSENDAKSMKEPEKQLFAIASLSKMFTALAIHDLILKEELNLETKIFSIHNTRFKKVIASNCPKKMVEFRNITVAHLLSHKSGININLPGSNAFVNSQAMQDGVTATNKDFDRGICDVELMFAPGSAVKYSNLAFSLLAQIVEAKTKFGSLDATVKAIVANPLGMRNFFYKIPKKQQKNLVLAYGKKKSARDGVSRSLLPSIYEHGPYEGPIGVTTNMIDLAKFGQEILSWSLEKPSKLHKFAKKWDKILDPITQRSKKSVDSFGFSIFKHKFKYNGDEKTYICYGDTGTVTGFRALLYVCPEIDWGFAVGLNARDANRQKYMNIVAEILLEKGYINNKRITANRLLAWMSKVKQEIDSTPAPYKGPKFNIVDSNFAPAHLKDYLGKYYADADGVREVRYSSNGNLVFIKKELILKDKYNPDHYRWPIEVDQFAKGESVEFVRDEAGKVVKLILERSKHFSKQK